MKKHLTLLIFFLAIAGKAISQCTITDPVPSTAVCQNGPVTLTVTSSGTVFQWYSNTSNSNSGGTSIPSATNPSYSPNTNIAGTFYYYCEASGVCGTITSNAAEVIVKSLPALNDISGVSPVCQGTLANVYSVTTDNTSVPATYLWNYSGTGATLSSTSGNSITIDFSNTATTGNLTVIETINGCPTTNTKSITVTPLPAVNAITGSSPVCAGTTGNVYAVTTNNTLSGATYSWTYSGTGATLSSTSGNSITVDFSSSAIDGNLTVAETISGCSTTNTKPITVTPLPAVNAITGSSPVCAGTSGNVYAVTTDNTVSGASYSWTYSGTGATLSSTSGNSITVDFSNTATDGNLTVVETISGCSTTNTKSITITPLPAVNAITGSSPVCAGTSGNVYAVTTDNTASPASYFWAYSGTGATLSSTSGNSITIDFSNTATSGNLTVVETISGCSTTNTKSITVTSLPAANAITGISPVCQGTTGNAYAVTTNNALATYNWSYTGSGATLSSTTGNSITINFSLSSTSGNLKVTETISGCTKENLKTITINPVPQINAMSETKGTGEAFTIIPADVTNGVVPTGTTYSWPAPIVETGISGGASGTDQSFISGTLSNSKSTSKIATYTVTPKTGSCTGASFQLQVTIYPAAVINPKTTTICSGATFTIVPADGVDGDVVPSGTTYTWPSPPAVAGISGLAGLSNQADIHGTLTSTANIPKNVVYTVTPKSGSKTGAAFTVTVTVNPSPTLTSASQAANVCNGNPARINLTGLLPGVTSGINFSIAGVAKTPVSVVSDGSGNGYFMTENLTVANDLQTLQITGITTTSLPVPNCTKSFTTNATLHVDPLPVASAGGSQTICSNGTATVSGASSANGTILWTENGAGSITSGATGLTPVYTAAIGDAGNNVTLTMTVTSNNSCSPQTATATYSVHVDPLPVATAGGSQTICSNGSATVSGASSANGSILWTENGAGSITSGETGLTPVYTASPGDAGNTVTLTMTVTSTNACNPSSATATYTVYVDRFPTATAGGSQTVCPYETAAVTGASATDGTILWTENGAGSITSGFTTLTPVYTPSLADADNPVTLTMTVTSNNTCTSSTAVAYYTVNINRMPSLTGISQQDPVCSGSPAIIRLTGLIPSSTSSVEYSIDGGPAQSVTVTADGTGAGSFSTIALASLNNGKKIKITRITVTSATPQCTEVFSMEAFLIVNTSNTPVITGNSEPCVLSAGNVYATDPGMTNYLWTFSGVPGVDYEITSGGSSTNNSVTVTWKSASTQSVRVNYTNINGCTAAAYTEKTINVKALPAPIITGPATVCYGSTGNVYTTEPGMLTYTWAVTGGNITSGGSGNMIIVTWNTSGTGQSVGVNYSNSFGCSAAAASVKNVTINPLPVIGLSGNLSVCAGSVNTYSTEGSMNNYVWEVPATATIISGGSSTDNSVTVRWLASGNFNIKVNYTNPITTCVSAISKSQAITVNSLPVPGITGPAAPLIASTGNIYTTEASMTGYSWGIPTGGTITSGTSSESIVVTWNAPGAHTINVNYVDGNNCTATVPTIKNISVNDVPSASSLTISGYAKVGSLLTANYLYSDADGDLEGNTTVEWFRDIDGTGSGWTSIAGPSTLKTYTLTNSDFQKVVKFKVRPVAQTGALQGIAYISGSTSVITNPPPVSTVPFISGTKNVGEALTGNYTYSDGEGDLESGSLYKWYSSPSATGTYTPIPGEVYKTHVIQYSEEGYYFKFEVTPRAATGSQTGAPVVSSGYGPANTKPYADNVIISGNSEIGSILTGSFNYHDIDNDPQGVCIYRWLRNSIPILNETAITYTLTSADEGQNISFEVTPVSTTGFPNTGVAVVSIPTANIIDPSVAAPIASEVCIEGTRIAGQTLKGKYRYTFYKPEGTSVFRWIRNGVVIGSQLQYVLTAADITSNEEITFEVTPVSSNYIPKTGAAVLSRPLARISMPQDKFTIAVNEVVLTANETGGIFSGPGVTNGKFSPSSVGIGAYSIQYLLTIINQTTTCSQKAYDSLHVETNVTSFIGVDAAYCKDGGPDLISVTGPDLSTSLGFSLTQPNGIVSSTDWTVTIDPRLMKPGYNRDILSFTYKNKEGYTYRINQPLIIDSVGTELKFIDINPAYCAEDPKQTISVSGVYPLGGTPIWTGDILSNLKIASADLDPQTGTPAQIYSITYQYKSQYNCLSHIISKDVTINPLPNPSFSIDSTYNIEGPKAQLIAQQTGGTFLGNGISGDYFFPDIAGLGEHTITYTITDANKCSDNLSKKTIVRIAQGVFNDIPSIICYRDTTYHVYVSGLPAGATVNTFTNLKNSLVHVPGALDADYSVTKAGAGDDKIMLSYKWDNVDYDIYKLVKIDSLGQVLLSNIDTAQVICSNSRLIDLNPSIQGGVFTGPVDRGYLDPSYVLGPSSVTYKYTNVKTSCSTEITVPFTVIPAPELSFTLADPCIESSNDPIKFINTTPQAELISWDWKDSDPGGLSFSNDIDASYLYKTGGLHSVTLSANTSNDCSVSETFTIDLGIKPEAHIYWKDDCFHENSSIKFIDSTLTFQNTDITSRTWDFFDGDTPMTEKEVSYPLLKTGYLPVQYIVNTKYKNCSDTVNANVYIRPSVSLAADDYFENFESGGAGWVNSETNETWSFGKPDRTNIRSAYSGNNAWFTPVGLTSHKTEPGTSPSVISPCFDFTGSERPMVHFMTWKRFDKDRDGAVLQYSVGNSKEWLPVGTFNDDGIGWYNSNLIKGNPGGKPLGWTTVGTPEPTWTKSSHAIDELKGKKDVKFRIAYGTDGSATENEGLAFDDFWVGERTRNVLLEHFANNSSTQSSNSTALVNTVVSKNDADVINIQYHTNFPGADSIYFINPKDQNARVLFYGLTKTPVSIVDGGSSRNDFALRYDYSSVTEVIDDVEVKKRSLIDPQFNISLDAMVSGSILTVSGKLTCLKDDSLKNLTLFLAVTEKENRNKFTGAGGEKTFYNLFRKFIPDAGGIILKSKWTAGESENIAERSWQIERVLNSSDIEIVAFLQNSITREVYQAFSVVKPQIMVGIENPLDRSSGSFSVYPNPAHERITISFGEPLIRDAEIKIYNIRGEAIKAFIAGPGAKEFIIEDPGFTGGMYLIRVSSGNKDFGFKKLIITGE